MYVSRKREDERSGTTRINLLFSAEKKLIGCACFFFFKAKNGSIGPAPQPTTAKSYLFLGLSTTDALLPLSLTGQDT